MNVKSAEIFLKVLISLQDNAIMIVELFNADYDGLHKQSKFQQTTRELMAAW